MATVTVDYALWLYLSCFRGGKNSCHRNFNWLVNVTVLRLPEAEWRWKTDRFLIHSVLSIWESLTHSCPCENIFNLKLFSLGQSRADIFRAAAAVFCCCAGRSVRESTSFFFLCEHTLKANLSDRRGQFLRSIWGVLIEFCKDSCGVTQDGLPFAGMRAFRGVSQLHTGKSLGTHAKKWIYVFKKCKLLSIIGKECKNHHFSKRCRNGWDKQESKCLIGRLGKNVFCVSDTCNRMKECPGIIVWHWLERWAGAAEERLPFLLLL